MQTAEGKISEERKGRSEESTTEDEEVVEIPTVITKRPKGESEEERRLASN